MSRRMSNKEVKNTLESTLQLENELLRTYAITAENVDDDELKERLHNLAEGNAKRTLQLESELDKL